MISLEKVKKLFLGYAIFHLFCFLSYSMTENYVKERIERTFRDAQEAFLVDSSGLESQRLLNQSRLLIDTIQPYFYAVSGPLHEYSEARQQRVEQVEILFSEYETLFLKLIDTLKEPTSTSNVVLSFVKFCPSLPAFKDALLDVARSDTTKPSNAAAAYDALFDLELDDQDIRKEIVSLMQWINDERNSKKGDLAAKVRNLAGAQWGMTEMLPYWQEIVSTPFASENFEKWGGAQKLATYYLIASRGLSRMALT
jgi:hypothetical protein